MVADHTKPLAAQLAALKQADKRLHSSLSTLCTEATVRSVGAAAVRATLEHDRATYTELQSNGVVMRHERSLLAVIDAVMVRLRPDALSTPPKTPHDRREAVAHLERAMLSAEAVAKKLGAEESASESVLRAFGSLCQSLAAPVDGAWRGWLQCDEAATLFRGARALALQPPGDLAAGLDGLERERAALGAAREQQALAAQLDALRGDGNCPRADTTASGPGAGARSGDASALFGERLGADVTERVSMQLRLASRLTATGNDHASAGAILSALAEGAIAAAKAARAAASVFGLLAPAGAVEGGGKDATDEHAAGELRQMAAEIEAQLLALERLEGRVDARELQSLAAALGNCYARQLRAAAHFVACAKGARGRRLLSKLAEVGERLEQAALEAQGLAGE